MSENKTHWKRFCNPDYLGAYSLNPGEEPILTIRSVGRELVTGEGGKKEECTVANFAPNPDQRLNKPMILNRTNCKTISAITGSPYVEDWVGRRIQIYATETKVKGSPTECLRIRPTEPKVKKPELTPGHPKWAGAVKSFNDGSTDLSGIRKYFDLSEENAQLLREEAANA